MTRADGGAEERDWLIESVRIAARNVEVGGGPFGALIVRDGEVVAAGVNQVTSLLDPTAHAEVVAIRQACWKLKRFSLMRLCARVFLRALPDVSGVGLVVPSREGRLRGRSA